MFSSASTCGLHNHKQRNELLKPLPLHSHGKYPISLFRNVALEKILERAKYFKEKLKVLFPADTQQTERAGIIICLTSLVLNIRFAERMQQLQDNDMKYRYLLMKWKADGKSLDLLEMNFNRKRDNVFIQSVTDTVIDFEYRSRLSSSVSQIERGKRWFIKLPFKLLGIFYLLF